MTSESEDLECGMHHRAYGIAKWVRKCIVKKIVNLLLDLALVVNPF